MPESTLERLAAMLRAAVPVRAVDPDRPQAAVALILAPGPDRMLLIRRADRDGDPWSGHLALPGGRRDPADNALLDTAIRETEEETGVVLQPSQLIAELDDLVPSTPTLPPLMVRPFVFVTNSAPIASVSDEVAHVEWVQLAMLAATGARAEGEVMVRGVPRRVPGYQLAQGFLWGITDRIITPVVTAWAATRR